MQKYKIGHVFYYSRRVLWALVCIGIILRLAQYLSNRSLWLDEVWISLNIINRSWLELLQPLDYNQGAPIGFLLVQKLLVHLFGNSEYTLRVFPLLCGIFSLILFYKLVCQLYPNKPNVALVALGLFVISERLIYYSSEVKQYSSDTTIALLILYVMSTYFHPTRLSRLRIAFFGVFGAIAIWCSHPSVFVLAGVGISLTVFPLIKKDWGTIGRLVIIFSMWTLSFIGLYMMSLDDLSRQKYLLSFWEGAFMPFPPSSFSDVLWFVKISFRYIAFMIIGISAVSLVGLNGNQLLALSLAEFVSLPLSSIAGLTYIIVVTCVTAFVFFVGCISIVFDNKKRGIVLIAPTILTLLASGLRKYPFEGRLLLFLIPLSLLYIAEGAEWIREKTQLYLPATGLILLGLVFLHPVLSASYYLIKPRIIEEVRPAIEYISNHRRDGDVLYVNHYAGYALQYYGRWYDLKRADYIIGKSEISDIGKFRDNGRVWVMFSYTNLRSQEFISRLESLDNIGRRIDTFTTTTGAGRTLGVGVYLYDFKVLKESKVN